MTNTPSESHRTGTDRAARLGLAVGLPTAIAVIAYVPFLLLRSELPDRVATHFDLSGRPDGSMTIGGFLIATGVFIALGVGLCIATSVKRPSDGALAATGGFLGGFLGGVGAGILATTSVAQRNLTDWRQASGAGWMVLGMLVVATALGVLGARFASRLDIDPARSGVTAPVMDLADGQEAVWVATSRSTPWLLAGWAGVIVGVGIAALTSWPVGLVVILVSLPILALSTLHVRADRRGLRIRYGHLPWPATEIDIERIEQATTIDVRPTEWGGWGYRGSLKLVRRAAVVHRAGPGIRLDLADNRVFVVTVDDPNPAVALLNAQVARTGASAC